MTDSGFNVSVRDVYNEVKALSDRLDGYLRRQEPAIAVLQQRVTEAESDIKDIRVKSEDTKKTRVTLQWQMVCVFVGSAIAALVPLAVK